MQTHALIKDLLRICYFSDALGFTEFSSISWLGKRLQGPCILFWDFHLHQDLLLGIRISGGEDHHIHVQDLLRHHILHFWTLHLGKQLIVKQILTHYQRH